MSNNNNQPESEDYDNNQPDSEDYGEEDPQIPARTRRNKMIFPLPKMNEGEYWRLAPIHRVNLTRDHSSASENGVKAVFGDNVYSADCFWHACPSYWAKDHRALLKSSEKLVQDEKVKEMNSDFEVLKNCPHLGLVPILKEEMLIFWKTRSGRNEVKFAEMWEKTYSSSNLTRVELNKFNPLRGGMPADNNISESGNRSDKLLRNYKKLGPIQFINDTVQRLTEESRLDMSFHGQLKPGVHDGRFMIYVWKTIEQKRKNIPCLLNVQFPFTASSSGVPPGSFLVPKYRSLCELLTLNEELSVEACTNHYRQVDNGFEAPLKTYKTLVQNPGRWLQDYKDDPSYADHQGFGILCDWTNRFCCMRPIVVSVGSLSTATSLSIATMLGILQGNGYSVIATAAVLEKEHGGLVSCDCKTYLHYSWCYHAAAVAFDRGIITEFPRDLNPKPAFVGKKRGRPANARRGGGLTQDD
jgi:hypothetical protein